jgi:hypothetical protein
MLQNVRKAWKRLSENLIIRTLWYMILLILIVLFYQGEVPFVYAQF